MPDERWRAIPAYRLLRIPRGYEASDDCRVRSVPRTLSDGRKAGGVVLEQQRDKDGYATVKLGGTRVRVAVVVQLAWAGPPEVRHLDDDRSNDRPGNLAWGSRVENEQDKRNRGRNKERDIGMEGECSSPSPIGTSPVTGCYNAG
jgi:hypothetical protein